MENHICELQILKNKPDKWFTLEEIWERIYPKVSMNSLNSRLARDRYAKIVLYKDLYDSNKSGFLYKHKKDE